MKKEMMRRHYEKPQMLVREIEACQMLAASLSGEPKARTQQLEEETFSWED